MGRKKAKKEEDVSELSRRAGMTLTVGIGVLAVIFLLPILVVLQNSFKSKLYISNEPFALPVGNLFAGLENYVGGVEKTGFLSAFGYGFIKSIPLEIEEAAMIDGCAPLQTFFRIVLPILKPTVITIAILNAMWIWNDYLLPYLVIGSDYKTIPIAVQYLRGGYGSVDMGAMMAMLVLAILPIIVFYLLSQKHIIKGVAAGAVKG